MIWFPFSRGGGSQLIYYVTDGTGWSFDEDARAITAGLERRGLETAWGTDPWKLRRAIVQFGNRYAFFRRGHRRFARRNRVFLTWFHGDPKDEGFAGLFSSLMRAEPGIEGVVVPCTISRDVLVGAGFPAAKITRIPIGVDTARFRPATAEERAATRAELGLPADARLIGSFQKDGAGMGDGMEPKPIKGPHVLVETLAKVHAAEPRTVALLTGPARGYVKQRLDVLGVPWRHRQLDEHGALAPLIAAADVCLITSRCEGGPKALLEGHACGVPVVSTRMGMPADVIRHGQNGMLAEIDDVDGLTAHVTALLADPALAASIRATARAECVDSLDWDRVAGMYYDLYSAGDRREGVAS